ncbi:copper-transporting ATPase [Geodermatophilus sp. YIM 151500]|uniref:cation transporter n=1 Tax=Geodermatophilus sp. YIM 151500 TaxID=2984531 RepID=UPI0021E4E436|nr:cation transporter [Geodermatophilus sp. YIM 151500]MCV2489795.1 copper-transporting ATPase [Geodermatophilus sp. YIM 151500]
MLSDTPRTFVGTTSFRVTGPTNAPDRPAIVDRIRSVGGVREVRVDRATGTVTVTVDSPVDRADIAAALATAGYTLLP